MRIRLSFGVFLWLLLPGIVRADNPPTPEASALPGVTAPPATPRDPLALRDGLNQFVGIFQSIDSDRKVFHLIVDTYNIEMNYNSKTKVMEGGKPLSLDALEYSDKIVARYRGRELLAEEIERLTASSPQP